ncbi:helicase-related protein [Dictyobacter arantiisoli]|uniref:ATP-dependent helicase HepA n=1 Tax=Dictyobacter arantiisoli TaxID=2014874 RepID=A0A5A5TJ94_9CHLR|nr:helicase-related protein [Dictyobacter arantiisoli]GCF11079.1 ATP-dependent helicase HepA [Dictyobacter arantiisoli]
MNFAVGSLVKARGREWIVLPESDEQMLILRPLGGTNDEVAGIYLPLESQDVESAQFQPPDPTQSGDYFSGRLLRDAVRFGFRSSAGPFRSFARIAVEPRPYQLVPLLMALRLDPIRILISDDVGIGKTVEAGLIARELLDRKEVSRMAVLCPPHLAEQWQAELQDKFHIDAELVLSSTITQLERACRQDESVFQHYPFLIISIDFVKSDRYRDKFVQYCPELVIVDEAHTCAYAGEGSGSRHQRYRLLTELAKQEQRHLIMVTATPHSGNEEAFRSLLRLLNPTFETLPADLSGSQNEKYREQLAAQFIQRRRADIRSYLDKETLFPDRADSNQDYHLTPEYKHFFEEVLEYARETVKDPSGSKNRQRVRWWSALALLRSLASSPAAAMTTLRNRAAVADAETVEEVDQIGRHTVLDLVDQDALEGMDVAPGGDFETANGTTSQRQSRLHAMADQAEQLQGAKDRKLQDAIKLIREMVTQGYQPIVFCRFIPTAEYVAAELRKALKGVEVAAITGLQPPVEREERIIQLAEAPQRVLVCTDCLSEGINLQTYFNAVVHYDLSWNPTRHEQREGRVDRFGQISPKVRVVTYFGADNQIDGLVLEVLIKKHKSIRKTLGVSVPVPADTEQVLEAVLEGLLLRGSKNSHAQGALPGFDDQSYQQRAKLDRQWDAIENREKQARSRAIYAQRSIKVDEVKQELAAVHAAIGEQEDVQSFTLEALKGYGATVRKLNADNFEVELKEVPDALRDAININRFVTNKQSKLKLSFNAAAPSDALKLSRTHPLVEGLAAYVMDTALDSVDDPFRKRIAYRSGVMYTRLVEKRTTLLLVRLRFHISTPDDPQPLLAEDCQVFAFRGAPKKADWIEDEAYIKNLLAATPDENISREQANFFLQNILDNFDEYLSPRMNELARERARELREAHRRVRRSAALSVRVSVEPQLPPDVLGMYVYLPYQSQS